VADAAQRRAADVRDLRIGTLYATRQKEAEPQLICSTKGGQVMKLAPYSNRFDAHRRRILVRASTVGAGIALGLSRTSRAEPPPETTTVRLLHAPAICVAPQYLAEEMLRLEGFKDIQFIQLDASYPGATNLAEGRADISMWDVPGLIPHMDAGKPVVLLAGVHAGCFELFGNERVHAIRDLKGKTLSVSVIGGSEYIYLSSMLSYLGVNPRKDVTWIQGSELRDSMRLFAEGAADAFLGFAPQPQELRAKGIGHVIVNTAQDRPWSQYFCCAVAANRNFVQQNPIATKRVLRAILKGAEICAAEPERAARYMADRGYEPRYEIGLEVVRSLPYRRWRDSNPEDTLRFHALRLHEAGMLSSNPQKLVAQATDRRFLDELRKELKA
jgi:NitT/TauT family transport system substrate-binding protein